MKHRLFSRSADSRERPPSGVRTDVELVAACRGGEREAFVEIVRRHQSLVCAIAYNITGNLTLSEDIAQDVFVRAWRKLADLREPEKLRGWLCRIASSLACNAAAKERRGAAVESPEREADAGLSPDEAAADGEEAALVWKTLETLPETLRLPLILFYREGESVAAVARALDLSEDAVKQRLARGRTALREKFTNLTASVLGRTQPGAVFTFTVLAAAGVLAAPSALAAAAFTGAGAASVAGSSSASLFTAMTVSKATLATAAALALLCIPAGYSVWELTHPATASGPPAAKPLQPDHQAVPDLNESAIIAEWRRLHEEHGAAAEDMPGLYQIIADIKDPFRRRAFRAALLSEWTELDPHAALAFFRAKKDGNLTQQVMREWMTRDAPAAVSALMASGEGWQETAKIMLRDITLAAPQMLMEIVKHLPKPEPWDTSIRDAFRTAAEGNLARTVAEAEAMTGPHRLQALAGAAGAWGARDPQAAWAWAEALGAEEEKNEALREVLAGWAKTDPAAALERVDLVPPGGDSMYYNSDIASRVLAAAAEKDFDGTLRWLKEHPGKVGGQSFNGLQPAITEKLLMDPAGTLEMLRAAGPEITRGPLGNSLLNDGFAKAEEIRRWLETQPDSPFVEGVRAALINSVAYKDPRMLLQWVGEMPETDKTPGKLDEIAVRLLNGGSDMEKIESLIAKAPPDLAQALVRTGFSSGNGWAGGDVKPWLERLDQVPEGPARVSAAGHIAGQWAATDPEAAVQWAGRLADEKTRVQSFAAIAGRWAGADSYEASQWISSLPPGVERDAAAQVLVTTIADVEPDSALTWAQTIANPDARRAAVATALQEWARKDLSGALRQLEGAALSPAEKMALQPVLEAAASGKLPPHQTPHYGN